MPNVERQGGFTLIEMMAVMMIIASISTLAVALAPGSGRARLKSVAIDTAALLRRERLGALMSGRPRHVAMDIEKRALRGESGGEVKLPADVAVALLGVDGAAGSLRPVVRFEPDGASTGAALAFERENVRFEVRVDWFTGGVSIHAR
ncbi:prepilin-type N-terminal cleavage/methylation domain-containing protein [Methylosinus sp. KRF6]|uniref:prepilin-type N-terminal cleavage/methylation domain-containing protein n=1 Tax=Methylosinus sp. KRF6 TaxID=2846853 RepID=UPI001C0A9C00|nr:prepilin-type N-terminal cleavage/methylation domain-containing protein [Methylosinus sp. KRF6]MBU3887025.1 prepilin-type N-terminal cleavage/methylation domain-containing protein [Methylosinus sp. KRF6]